MNREIQEKIVDIVREAPEAYARKESEIKSMPVGGYAASLGRSFKHGSHKVKFYWNYFGGKNKEYSPFSKEEARPLPFLMPEEINETYLLLSSTLPELVKSGVIGEAISVLVQNCWKANEFNFELGSTEPARFCSGLEKKCIIRVNGNVGQDSLRKSNEVSYLIRGSIGAGSIQELHNCNVVAEDIKSGIDKVSNCIIKAKGVGINKGYAITNSGYSAFNIESVNGGIHGKNLITDTQSVDGDIWVDNSVLIIRGTRIPAVQLSPFRDFYMVKGKNSKILAFDKQMYDFWRTMIEKNATDFKINRHSLDYWPPELIFAQGNNGRGDFGKGLGYIEGRENYYET